MKTLRRAVALAAVSLLAAAGITAAQPATAAPLHSGAVPIATPAPDTKRVLIQKPIIGKDGKAISAAEMRRLALVEYRMYAGAEQFISTTTGGASGADAVMVKASQHKAYSHGTGNGCATPPSPCYDYGYSLWETAVSDVVTCGGSVCVGNNRIEIGYHVSTAHCNQTTSPCLWVTAWRDNGSGTSVTSGYGANFIDNPSEAVGAYQAGVQFGTALAVTASGAVPSVFYEYKIERVNSTMCDGVAPTHTTATTGWQLRQQNVGSSRIIGCFPDSYWTANSQTFTKAAYAASWTESQSIGDGSTAGDAETTMCTDGGSGVFGTSTTPSAALRIDDLVFTNPPAGVTPDWTVFTDWAASDGSPDPGVDPTAVRSYKVGATDYKAGGPGFNSAGTGTGSVGSC